MIKISRLEEASDSAVKDINFLLPQVRSDPSQHKGSLVDLQNIVGNHWTSMIVARDEQRIIEMATIHIVNNMGNRLAHVDDLVISGRISTARYRYENNVRAVKYCKIERRLAT